MEITTSIHELHPRGSFRIARKRTEPFANVLLRVERDGICGWGEASPNPYYGVTAEDVTRTLAKIAGWLRKQPLNSVADIERIWEESWEKLKPNRAAQCALDLALWDWLARKEGVTVCELAHGRKPQPVTSFATIGLSTPEELDGKIAELRGFPRVKIKSDASADLEPARRVKAELGAAIAIDANCAWKPSQLPMLSVMFSNLGVEFIEQPFSNNNDEDLVRGSYALPIFADESCVVHRQVPLLARHFDGINVKLVKCGGLTPALAMVNYARERDMRTMVGCMLETSVLIAAGCVVAQNTDYADLDGAWLIEDDPCTGWRFDHGVLHPPDALGLGAEPREG